MWFVWKVKLEKDNIQDEPWIEQLRNESIEFVHTLEGHLQDEDTFADDFVSASDKYGLLACVDCVCVCLPVCMRMCVRTTHRRTYARTVFAGEMPDSLKTLVRVRQMETAIETNEEISLLAVLSLFSRRYNPRSLFLLPLDNMFRRGIIAIVEWPVVDYFIMFVIFANVVTMALEDPLVPGESAKNRTLDIFSIVFIVIFTLEAALKVVAYGFFLGPYAYLKDPWNCIDFFIVVTGLFDVLDAAHR